MKEWKSQSHVMWDCKYHLVFITKYRQRAIYGKLKQKIGGIIRDLCRQKGVELHEGHAMPDHIHLLLSKPPRRLSENRKPKHIIPTLLILPQNKNWHRMT